MPIASRLTNTGTLLVNGSFDENTSITPAKFRTTSTTVSAGTLDETALTPGSFNFNGTSQVLTVPANAAFSFAGDFTIEGWMYFTNIAGASPQSLIGMFNTTWFDIRWFTSRWQVSLNAGSGTNIGATPAPVNNTWVHVACVRSSGVISLYVGGVATGTTLSNATTLGYSTVALGVGADGRGAASGNRFTGNITNLRIVNGTALYTANFTPPVFPPTAVTNTQLLLNMVRSSNSLTDSSTNNFTVTNVGSATWGSTSPDGPFITKGQRQVNDGTQEVYTQFDEFTGAPVVDTSLMVWVDAGQTASYSGSGTTWTDLSSNAKNYTLANSPTFNSITGGGVITFAGASSQYATTASTLFNSTTTNTYSVNIWVYPTGAGQIVSVDGQSTPDASYHYTAMEITAAGLIYLGQWTGTNTVIASSSQSLNAWYNLVITYNGTTATAYVNGTSVGSSAIAWSAPGANTFFALMSQDSTNMSATTAYASGSIGAFMVYNRALTADEVTTNFNALRNRYGI